MGRERKRRKCTLEKNYAENEDLVEREKLEQELVKKEAQIKFNNTEREKLVKRITLLQQELIKKDALLKLNGPKKEDLVEQITIFEQELEKKEVQLELKYAPKEDLNQYVGNFKEQLEKIGSQLKLEKEQFLTKNRALTKRLIIAKQKLGRISDKTVNLNSLPNEILLKIFGYLKHDELCRVRGVCRKWKTLVKSPVLWKQVNVKILQHFGLYFNAAVKFVELLPPLTRGIRLDLSCCQSLYKELNFENFSISLRKKCPNLKNLILYRAELSVSLPSVVYLCSKILQNVRVLVLHECEFTSNSTKEKYVTSKIEVLDVSACFSVHFDQSMLLKMPNLKKLRLANTNISDSWFKNNISFPKHLEILDVGHTCVGPMALHAIRVHCLHLTKLYMCNTYVDDNDLKFNNSPNVFPNLKLICLGNSPTMTSKGINSLIKLCPSLQHVYVWNSKENLGGILCKSKIVVVHSCYHYKEVDYLQV